MSNDRDATFETVRQRLTPYADDLAAAIETADDPDRGAALRTLAALARGETIPPQARARLREWLEEERE